MANSPGPQTTPYCDWKAVFAGAVLAASLSFVLLTAGISIGLSFISTDPNQSFGTSAAWFAAFWSIAVPIGSLLAGGYIAGRMRSTWSQEDAEESSFRDGVHGALVWSLSVILSSILAVSTAVSVGRLSTSAVASASDIAATIEPAMSELLRGQRDAGRPELSEDQRREISRILVNSVRTGTLAPSDKTYLAQTTAQITGLPPEETEKRATEAFAAARKYLDDARKTASTVGLVTVTALLLSLAAAWYAAQRGGHHRDIRRPARFFYRTAA
jgi:hypothetical protein